MTIESDELEFQISQFEEAVEDIERNFPDTDVFGSTRARTPIIRMYKIRWLLAALEESSIGQDDLNKYNHLNERFEEFVRDHHTPYIQSVFEEFEWFVERYPTLVCSFLELDPIDNELIEAMNRRDTIEVLHHYLTEQGESNPSVAGKTIERAGIRVNALDEVLRCQFRKNITDILNNHSYIQKQYFPDRFWWRHPESLE